MPRGQPDWGQYAQTQVIGGLSDLGEAVARLGAVGLFDRRGMVLWWDDFEMGLQKWDTAGPGTGSVSWSTDTARIGRYCAKLVTGTSVPAHHAYINLTLPFEIRSRLGIEFAYTIAAFTDYLSCSIQLWSGAIFGQWGIKINHADQKLYYFGSDGVYHDSGSASRCRVAVNGFNVVKVVIDLETAEYVRLIGNGLETDMSGKVGDGLPGLKPDSIIMQIYHNGDGSHNAVSYIDDVIVTLNEP